MKTKCVNVTQLIHVELMYTFEFCKISVFFTVVFFSVCLHKASDPVQDDVHYNESHN